MIGMSTWEKGRNRAMNFSITRPLGSTDYRQLNKEIEIVQHHAH